MTYNGWSTWATWNVALWMDNDESIYRDRMRAKPATAEECKAFVHDYFPNGTPDMQDDAWDAPREGVNWEEIAEHWASDYESEEDEEVTDDEDE